MEYDPPLLFDSDAEFDKEYEYVVSYSYIFLGAVLKLNYNNGHQFKSNI